MRLMELAVDVRALTSVGNRFGNLGIAVGRKSVVKA
jgi:hypothetical protein